MLWQITPINKTAPQPQILIQDYCRIKLTRSLVLNKVGAAQETSSPILLFNQCSKCSECQWMCPWCQIMTIRSSITRSIPWWWQQPLWEIKSKVAVMEAITITTRAKMCFHRSQRSTKWTLWCSQVYPHRSGPGSEWLGNAAGYRLASQRQLQRRGRRGSRVLAGSQASLSNKPWWELTARLKHVQRSAGKTQK